MKLPTFPCLALPAEVIMNPAPVLAGDYGYKAIYRETMNWCPHSGEIMKRAPVWAEYCSDGKLAYFITENMEWCNAVPVNAAHIEFRKE